MGRCDWTWAGTRFSAVRAGTVWKDVTKLLHAFRPRAFVCSERYFDSQICAVLLSLHFCIFFGYDFRRFKSSS